MEYRFLAVRRDGAVEYVTLNRPDVRNAFNDQMIAELSAWAAAAREDLGIRIAVIAGAGKTFSAGADASWMAKTIDYSHDNNVHDATAMASMFQALNTLPFVVIGRVHGAALGGGSGLAAICDVVIAEDTALFGFTETKLGILPAVISPYVLPKIGVSAARELFLTGMRFSARRAKEIGLVHAVVAGAELDATVQAYIEEGLTAAPSAIAAAKALIPQVSGRSAEAAMPLTAEAIAAQRVSPEGQEGLRAFLNKTKPGWVRRES